MDNSSGTTITIGTDPSVIGKIKSLEDALYVEKYVSVRLQAQINSLRLDVFVCLMIVSVFASISIVSMYFVLRGV